MRFLCFDVGTKKIGVAISDETQTIATPLYFIKNDDRISKELEKIINQYNPERIIVGHPVNMNGTENKNNNFLLEFLEKLKKIFDEKKIILWDERLTTFQAEKILLKVNVKRKQRKMVIDKISAAIILQNYLDFIQFQNKK